MAVIPSSDSGSPAGSPLVCVTKDDLLAYRVGCNLVDVCCPCDEINLQLEIAYSMVSIITGTEWCPQESCVRFNGSGSDILYFPPMTSENLSAITTVKDLSCCTDAITYDNSDLINFGHWVQINEACSGTTTCSSIFPCGDNNIEVCGSWGKTMPAAIKRAIIMLALEGIEPGLSGLANPNGVRSATWEDFRISYSVEERPRGLMTTGYQEIDDLLVLYTNTIKDIGFSIVPESSVCLPRDCGIVQHTRGSQNVRSNKRC